MEYKWETVEQGRGKGQNQVGWNVGTGKQGLGIYSAEIEVILQD